MRAQQVQGGTVDISGTINAGFTNQANSYVSFTDVGSTFTARFGTPVDQDTD